MPGGGRDGQPHLYQRNRSGNLKGRFYTRASASAGGAIPCRGFPEDEMKKTQALNPAVRYKLDQVDDRFVPIEAGWKYTVGDYTLEMISVPGHTPECDVLGKETGHHVHGRSYPV